MIVDITKDESKAIAAISGRLDTVTSAELKAKLEEAEVSSYDLELDFTEVEYISSAGLRLLVLLQKQAIEGGHTLVIKNINNVVREVFKVAGFNKTLTII